MIPVDPMLVWKHFGWGLDISGAQVPTLANLGDVRDPMPDYGQKAIFGISIENVKIHHGALLGAEYLYREGELGKIVGDLF